MDAVSGATAAFRPTIWIASWLMTCTTWSTARWCWTPECCCLPCRSSCQAVARRNPENFLMADPVPRISVVVPAFQASASIERCLGALARQTLPAEHYEVIVVDDGSTDDTAVRASRCGARVVRLFRNQGPAQAR